MSISVLRRAHPAPPMAVGVRMMRSNHGSLPAWQVKIGKHRQGYLRRLLCGLLLGTLRVWSLAPCRIEVIDQQNGWPIPLVQLRTTHSLTFVTDNAGVIALDAPELMGREVWFDVIGHGYSVKKAVFDLLRVVWTKSNTAPHQPAMPEGHPALWKDPAGTTWVLFGNPLPTLRCLATFEAWQDASKWEVLTPQKTLPTATGSPPVTPHSGHIAWNGFRRRWITVFLESGGEPSRVGEIWYAEAALPSGPWGRAVKILSHENYTFYNPRLHPEFTPADSPVLLFEGTYSSEFADRPVPTARYNYNQILYRLDLDDPLLRPAAAQN